MNLKDVYQDKELRKLAGEHSLYHFALFYFPHIFTSKAAPFHRKMCGILDKDEEFKRVLFLMFRESAKTVYAKIKFIHNICYDKKRFQIYCCFDKKKARSNLFDIARQLQTNKAIIEDFGQLFYEDKQKDLKQSTKKSIGEFITRNDVKCLAFSIGESPRGLLYGSNDGEFRPDFWVLDDIDVQKAVENIEVINKSWEWFESELLAGLSPDANVLFLGNRVKQDGVIPRIEEKINVPRKIVDRGEGFHSGKNWTYLNVPVEIDGVPTWSARFSIEPVKGKIPLHGEGSKEEDLGQYAYKSQMCNIIDPGDKFFDISKVQITAEEEMNHSGMNLFMCSDLAISEKKSADETVHIVVGVDAKGHFWVVDMFHGRVKPDKSIDELMKLHQKYKPLKYGLETVSFQKSMKYAIEDRQRTMRHQFKITELKADQKKFERILGMQPIVELGKLHILRSVAMDKKGENILDQLNNFPYGKHDDIIDALAYILQLAFPVYND